MEYAISILLRKIAEIDAVLVTIDEPCCDFTELNHRRKSLEIAIYILQHKLIEETQIIEDL
jgi:hypothetical protein